MLYSEDPRVAAQDYSAFSVEEVLLVSDKYFALGFSGKLWRWTRVPGAIRVT